MILTYLENCVKSFFHSVGLICHNVKCHTTTMVTTNVTGNKIVTKVVGPKIIEIYKKKLLFILCPLL